MNLSYHTWITNQSIISMHDIQNIKTTIADFIHTTYFLPQSNRELRQDYEMDEYYQAAPQNVFGSDRVFVTPHIDGIFGIIPFMRTWRCIYGLTDGHNVYTQVPFLYDAPVHIVKDSFYCFDYNRDIHWIYDNSTLFTSHRSILKLHFFEYPRELSWLSSFYVWLNTRYNQMARSYFILSQQPYYSQESYLWSCIINTITQTIGTIELYVGFVNIGILFLLLVKARSIKECILHVSICYWFTDMLSEGLTDWTPALLNRDTNVYLCTLVILYGINYPNYLKKSTWYNLVGPRVLRPWLPPVLLSTEHYYDMYKIFQTYHTSVYNVIGHIVCTSVAYICVLGLGKPDGFSYTKIMGYGWLISRYTIPEAELRMVIVSCMLGFNYILQRWGYIYTRLDYTGILLLSIYLQDKCHDYYGEATFMSHYIKDKNNIGSFIEHSVWLFPFEMRALNNFMGAK